MSKDRLISSSKLLDVWRRVEKQDRELGMVPLAPSTRFLELLITTGELDPETK